MKKVWKYQPEPKFNNYLNCMEINLPVPSGSTILKVGFQDLDDKEAKVTFWCEVDPNGAIQTRIIYIFPTGAELPEMPTGYKLHYGDTISNAGFVWHVYERLAKQYIPGIGWE